MSFNQLLSTASNALSGAYNLMAPNNKKVVFADFDNTQLMTKDQVAVKSYDNIVSMLSLRHLVAKNQMNLVHCTGRVGAQIIRDIESGDFSNLPFSVAAKAKTIIAGVGTEIHHLNQRTGQYEPDNKWRQKMVNTGFTPAVRKLLDSDGAFQPDFLSAVSDRLGADIALKGQEVDKQTEFKQSLWGSPQDGVSSDDIKAAIIDVMKDRGMSSDTFSITVSVQTSKIAVDLTPKGATKPEACEYIMQEFNIKPENALCAGDSGNDTHLTHIKGVMVSMPANAQSDLIEAVDAAHRRTHIHCDQDNEAAAGLIVGVGKFGHVTQEQIEQAYSSSIEMLEKYDLVSMGLTAIPQRCTEELAASNKPNLGMPQ